MDTKNLLTLKTIIKTGSFQKAAEELGYTPSTITFQIRQLEQELSVQLFEKIGRKMTLTQAGKSMMPLIDGILQNYDIIKSYSRSPEEMHGDLTVAMPETLLVYRMENVLAAFREQAPAVNLSIRIGDCFQTREQVLHGVVDIGIHYDLCPDHASILSEKIGEYKACLVASPKLPVADRDFITRNQTKKISLINYYSGSIFQDRIDNYLKHRQIQMPTMMELTNVEAIKRSVENGIGIAYLPENAIEAELAQKRLIKLPTDMDADGIVAVCEFHKNKWISPQIELFLKLVRERM